MYLEDGATVSRVLIERVLDSLHNTKAQICISSPRFSFRGQIEVVVCPNYRRLNKYAIYVESRLASNSSCSTYLNDPNVSVGVLM